MNLLPRLVIDQETKKLCMQITYAGQTQTKALPDIMATWTISQIEEYVASLVPDMIQELRDERKKKIDIVKRKAGE